MQHEGVKNVVLLLPLPLDAKKYSSRRMVGQIGFTYYDEGTVQKVVSDEYGLLEQAGIFRHILRSPKQNL